MKAVPELGQLAAAVQQKRVEPLVLQFSGCNIDVERHPDGSRVITLVHQSGVLAAVVPLDAINAAVISGKLSSSAESVVADL